MQFHIVYQAWGPNLLSEVSYLGDALVVVWSYNNIRESVVPVNLIMVKELKAGSYSTVVSRAEQNG